MHLLPEDLGAQDEPIELVIRRLHQILGCTSEYEYEFDKCSSFLAVLWNGSQV